MSVQKYTKKRGKLLFVSFFQGGPDEARTRDPMRDRHVF